MAEPAQLNSAPGASSDPPSRLMRGCLLGLAALAVWRCAVMLIAVEKRVTFP
jgi:hypothetical protein